MNLMQPLHQGVLPQSQFQHEANSSSTRSPARVGGDDERRCSCRVFSLPRNAPWDGSDVLTILLDPKAWKDARRTGAVSSALSVLLCCPVRNFDDAASARTF